MVQSVWNIVDAAEALGLVLEASGDEFTCRCPVHDDTNPSLWINPRENAWYCFGCRRGGGVLQLARFVGGRAAAQILSQLPLGAPTTSNAFEDVAAAEFLARASLVARSEELAERVDRAAMARDDIAVLSLCRALLVEASNG